HRVWLCAILHRPLREKRPFAGEMSVVFAGTGLRRRPNETLDWQLARNFSASDMDSPVSIGIDRLVFGSLTDLKVGNLTNLTDDGPHHPYSHASWRKGSTAVFCC